MTTQVVLIVIGAALVVVAIVGSGEYWQFKVPSLPALGRALLGIAGCGIFTLAFTPLANSASRPTADLPAPSASLAVPGASPTSALHGKQVAGTRAPSSLHTSAPSSNAELSTAAISVKCSLSQKLLRPGITVRLTYDVESRQAVQVGLGAALYDNKGSDHSTGFGDVSSTPLAMGHSREIRPVLIPAILPPGRYELDAEIWPPNKVGSNGVNTFADAVCAYFKVP